MKLTKTKTEGTCSWCGKTKDVVYVTFDDGTDAVLCWADLKRMAGVRLPQEAAEQRTFQEVK